MKSRYMVLIAAVLLAGCAWDFTSYADGVRGLPHVNSIVEAWRISSEVRYVKDIDGSFKEPWETYLTMEGDCEDIASLMLALVEVSGIAKGYIVIVRTSVGLHALVEINGVYYEAQDVYAYRVNPDIVTRMDLGQYIAHKAVVKDA